jgi:hypothetical protein
MREEGNGRREEEKEKFIWNLTSARQFPMR